MANRYLRANGNWNGAVWAATSGGAAGSAATPTAGDSVNIDANFTVTLDTDIVVDHISQTNGTLTCGPYNVTANYYGDGNSSSAKTLNMGSGTWTLTNGSMGVLFGKNNANTTVNAQSSLLILNIFGGQSSAYPIGANTLGAGFTLNDVIFNIGTTAGDTQIGILGSPTFNSLVLQSKNSSTNTVEFQPLATITARRFVAIGSSAANRMIIQPSDYPGLTTQISGVDVSYGKWVNVRQLPVQPLVYGQNVYIGSTSVNSASVGWLTQDPPSISTLVDPMTTSYSSSSYWTTSGTVSNVTTGARGGGYSLGSGAALTSKDVYNVLDTEFIVEMKGGTGQTILPILESMLGVNGQKNYITVGLTVPPGQQAFFDAQFGDEWYPLDTGDPGFLKIKINSNGTLNIAYSQDGLSWDVSVS